MTCTVSDLGPVHHAGSRWTNYRISDGQRFIVVVARSEDEARFMVHRGIPYMDERGVEVGGADTSGWGEFRGYEFVDQYGNRRPAYGLEIDGS